MTEYRKGYSVRHRGWTTWAALVLGLLFLGLGAPLMMQHDRDASAGQTERQVDEPLEPVPLALLQ